MICKNNCIALASKGLSNLISPLIKCAEEDKNQTCTQEMQPSNKFSVTYVWHRSAEPNVVPLYYQMMMHFSGQHLRGQHLIMCSSELLTWQLAEYLKRIQGDKSRWQTTLTSHSSSSCTCITHNFRVNSPSLSFLPPLKHSLTPPHAFSSPVVFSEAWGRDKELHSTCLTSIPYTQVITFVLFSTTFITIPTD